MRLNGFGVTNRTTLKCFITVEHIRSSGLKRTNLSTRKTLQMEQYEKIRLNTAIADDALLGLVFISPNKELPQRASNEGHGIYVSKPLYFRTKRGLFSGYYHFGDNNFYSDVLTHKSGYAQRIENVAGWCLQN